MKFCTSSLYGREKEMFTDNTFVGIGLNILGILDNGITSTAAEIVERTVRAISNRSIDSDVKEELKCFDQYSIAEMEERLPLFLQYDLYSYTVKHPDMKILIVFDTFEAINENVIEQVHRSRNERWIQEIISYFDSETFPNLLVTIFGRDRIEWDSEWNDNIEQYQLKEFEEEFSVEYLMKAGLEDREVIRAIINSSNGYPFLLYLSLETYAHMRNSGKLPRPDDFSGSYPQIIERFLYNIDKDTVEVLRLMAIPNFYNVDIFKLLINEFNISFPMTEFEQFNKYSFVSFDEKEQDYYIHGLMREGILEKTSSSIQNDAHSRLQKYYSVQYLKYPIVKYALEMFYHARKHMAVEAFNMWLEMPIAQVASQTPLDILKQLQTRGEQSTLLQIIEGIRSDYVLEDWSLSLINIYIDIVHLGGAYEEAVNLCESYLSQFDADEIMASEQLVKMRIRKIHHSMFYMPVDQLLQEAEAIEMNDRIKSYPEQYNELLFLLGGNLGVLSGNWEYCTKWLERSMKWAEEYKLDSFIHRNTRKQADLLISSNKYDEALMLIERTVSLNDHVEDINSRYKIYLMGVLGELYRKLGKCEYALHCYEIVEKKATENYLPGWQAHAVLGIGMVKLHRNLFQEARECFDVASGIYTRINQKWGIINSSTAKILLNIIEHNEYDKEQLDVSLEAARKMKYQYNVDILERIQNNEQPYLQLFFL